MNARSIVSLSIFSIFSFLTLFSSTASADEVGYKIWAHKEGEIDVKVKMKFTITKVGPNCRPKAGTTEEQSSISADLGLDGGLSEAYTDENGVPFSRTGGTVMNVESNVDTSALDGVGVFDMNFNKENSSGRCSNGEADGDGYNDGEYDVTTNGNNLVVDLDFGDSGKLKKTKIDIDVNKDKSDGTITITSPLTPVGTMTYSGVQHTSGSVSGSGTIKASGSKSSGDAKDCKTTVTGTIEITYKPE